MTLAYDGPRNGRDTVRTLVVARSTNPKLSRDGRAAATYRTQGSCPDSCAFYPVRSACYADTFRGFGHAVRNGQDGAAAAAIAALAETVPAGGIVRFNVSGDYMTADGRPDRAYIRATNALARRRPDVTYIAYTHAWRKLRPSWFAYTVNASCDSAAETAAAAAAGWPTVAAVPADGRAIGRTVAGRRIVQCPATVDGRDTSCAECRLCSRAARASTVAFPTHGTGARAAAATISAGWTVAPDGRIVRAEA
jgi:hypothetical protein